MQVWDLKEGFGSKRDVLSSHGWSSNRVLDGDWLCYWLAFVYRAICLDERSDREKGMERAFPMTTFLCQIELAEREACSKTLPVLRCW
jgi:hypothetical protein